MAERFHVASWNVLALVMFVCLPSVARTTAQPGNNSSDTESRVLEILFPRDTPDRYFEKVVMRFWDTDTQIVIVVYPAYPPHPGGQAEIIRYSLVGTSSEEFWQMISNMEKSNPNITAEQIATKFKVDVSRSPIDYKVLKRSLKELQSLQISPALENRIGLDNVSIYEFWYDTGQESVHYTILDPSGDDHQDKLGRWMEKFRRNLPGLLKSGSSQKP